MKKTITGILIVGLGLLTLFAGCDGINPFEAGGVLPETESGWIYFNEGNLAKRIKQDGTSLENLFTINLGATESIRRLQVDRFRDKLYLYKFDSTPTKHELYECNLDGSDMDLILDLGLDSFLDMKLDPAAGLLYFATHNTFDFKIRKVDLYTGNIQQLYSNPWTGTFFMAPDYQGNLYFTLGAGLSKLSGPANVYSGITLNPPLGSPSGTTFDRNSKSLYVADAEYLKKINLSTSTWNIILTEPDFAYRRNMEVSYPDSKLIFLSTDYNTFGELYGINPDGTGLVEIYSTAAGIGGFDLLLK